MPEKVFDDMSQVPVQPRVAALQLLKHLGPEAYEPETLDKPLVLTPAIFVEAVRQQPIVLTGQQVTSQSLNAPVRLEKHQGYGSTQQQQHFVFSTVSDILWLTFFFLLLQPSDFLLCSTSRISLHRLIYQSDLAGRELVDRV